MQYTEHCGGGRLSPLANPERDKKTTEDKLLDICGQSNRIANQ